MGRVIAGATTELMKAQRCPSPAARAAARVLTGPSIRTHTCDGSLALVEEVVRHARAGQLYEVEQPSAAAPRGSSVGRTLTIVEANDGLTCAGSGYALYFLADDFEPLTRLPAWFWTPSNGD